MDFRIAYEGMFKDLLIKLTLNTTVHIWDNKSFIPRRVQSYQLSTVPVLLLNLYSGKI